MTERINTLYNLEPDEYFDRSRRLGIASLRYNAVPMSERITFALPTGELEKDVINFIGQIGVTVDQTPRRYFVPSNNIPIDFVLMRASSIPSVVKDDNSSVSVGISGSDLIWESRWGKDKGQELPIYDLNPDATKWSLYIGITEKFSEEIKTKFNRSPRPSDLEGSRIATKYANIANDYFTKKGIPNMSILYAPGTDEAMPYIYPDCYSILSVLNSGKTLKANNLEILDTFYQATINMIKATDKLSYSQQRVLEDFQERIQVAVQKARMV